MERLQTRGIRPAAPYNLRSPWNDNRMPSTAGLSGRTVRLTRDDGEERAFAFENQTVTWSDGARGQGLTATYDAVEMREDIFFVDFLHDDNEDDLTSIVLNLRTNGAILLEHTIVRGAGRADLQQDLYPCVVSETDGIAPDITEELVGRRAYAEYADGHAVEHVYFNPRRIVWQGLGDFVGSGAECDHSTMWKIDEKLYLLTWVEEWQAVGAALLLDYIEMRNVGVLYGLDEEGRVHTLCGARLALLSELKYPLGYEPAGVGAGVPQR